MVQKYQNKLLSILQIVVVLTLIACDNKRDSSDLYGQWQLIEWRNNDGIVVKTKEDRIFYCCQLSLLQLTYHHYCRYRETPDYIIIEAAYYNQYDTDTPIELEELEDYGIPSDGVFRIQKLNDDDLVLSGSNGTLRFRKY